MALGDSLAFGILDFEGGGYVPRYGTYVQADNQVTLNLSNFGRNGWTSAQLLNALRADASFRQAIAASQVVTWDIGGNDFLRARTKYQDQNNSGACGGADNQDCFRSTVAEFKQNWAAIISEILSLRSTNNTIIRTMDIYNPFVNAGQRSDSWAGDGGLNDFQALKLYIDEVNNYIAATSAANNIPCAKASLAFNGPAGTEDPGSKGYLTLTECIRTRSAIGCSRICCSLILRSFGRYARYAAACPRAAHRNGDARARHCPRLGDFHARSFSGHHKWKFQLGHAHRLMLFATGVEVVAGEELTAVTAQAEDSQLGSTRSRWSLSASLRAQKR
ncbi:MAG: GDSL-type esterase/lipase family protein [Pyrinomonadaceae bacterium]